MTKRMQSKYQGRCDHCGESFPVGTEIVYDGTARHVECGSAVESVTRRIERRKAVWAERNPGVAMLDYILDGADVLDESAVSEFVAGADDAGRVKAAANLRISLRSWTDTGEMRDIPVSAMTLATIIDRLEA